MDYDLFLVIGVTLAVLTIPSVISAWLDGRPPRMAAILLMAAVGLIIAALTQSARPYSIAGFPHLFIEVLGRYLR